MIRFSRPPDRPRVQCLPKAGGPDSGPGLWRILTPSCMSRSSGFTWTITYMHHLDGGKLRAGNHVKRFHRGPSSRAAVWRKPCKPRRAQNPQAVQRSRKLPVGCGHHPASFGSARGCATHTTHSSEATPACGPPDPIPVSNSGVNARGEQWRATTRTIAPLPPPGVKWQIW